MAVELSAAASRTRVDPAQALKDAALAALLAFGLFLPLIGLRTVQDIRNELTLETRWPLLLILVAIVGLGRLVYSLAIYPWLQARLARPAAPSATRTAVSHAFARWFTPFALGFVAVYPILAIALAGQQGALKWIDNFGIQVLIYVMLGWGLNIVVGLAGLLDLGYVAFYAVGAYAYALLAKTFGLSFWILLPLAGTLAAFWGILLGFPVLRLRGDYLAIVTLAFGEIIRLILINWVPVTNGYAGISGIPRPTFFGIPFNASDEGFAATFGLEFTPLHRTIFLYYVILGLALVTAYVTVRLRRLPVGRAWEALREDEIACRSLGINTTNTKLTAFAMGAMFGGFAGSFFAARQGFISPESFTFMESAIILAIVVLGGMGSQIGVAIAAIVMIGGTEIMRDLDFLKRVFGNDFDPTQYRMLIFGFAMVLIMIWKPRGLIGTREPSAFLKERKAVSRSLGAGRPRMTSTAADPVLRVEHLTMRFGGLVAVNDLSFTAGVGDITALIGPNGAGKTTVFNCITGFYKPTEGRIGLRHGNAGVWQELDGLTDSSRRSAHRADGALFLLERMPDYLVTQKARVARTFQNIRLFTGMTVLENLLVAQHNPLMVASGFTFLGVLGLPSYARRGGRCDRQGALLARQDAAHRARRRSGRRPALRGAAPARDRARHVHRSDPALPRRACCRPQSARERRAQRTAAVDPQRVRHLGSVDRARHVGGDGDFRPRRRARLRRQDLRRVARRDPQRPDA